MATSSAALRTALHDALLSGSDSEQSQLLNSLADLGTPPAIGWPPSAECDDAYIRDHEANGMSGLDSETRDDVRELAVAYREHFGFPLIVSARDVADRYSRVLSSGWARMANSPAVERGAALIEIAKIANYRFDDLVDDANPIASARAAQFAQQP